MKTTLFFILFSAIVGSSCNKDIDKVNYFSSENDTLIIKTEKVKGVGMFPAGAGQINFKDTTERYEYPVIFPKNITGIKLALRYIDNKPFQFKNLKENNSDYMMTFLDENFPGKIDTSNIPSIKENTICIMSGKQGNENVFIVDENNNKDFRDDSVRFYYKMDWHTTDQLIKCKYKIFDGEKVNIDSTWINIGELRGRLWFFVSHHLVSTFSVDNQKYQVGLVDDQSNFCFDEPILALISENGVMKDSLLKSELLNKGEYLKLGDSYFKFEDISNDGKLITLVKERDVSNKIGTQVGFIAPSFKSQTISGDSISSSDYKGKYLLLVNITACWSPVMSYKYFKELTEKYASKLDIIGIDNSPSFLEQNIKDLNLTGTFIIAEINPSIQNNYREDFCSRTCFLINPQGRITDKFEISDWKKALSKNFN
jgi:peroxiredoxin